MARTMRHSLSPPPAKPASQDNLQRASEKVGTKRIKPSPFGPLLFVATPYRFILVETAREFLNVNHRVHADLPQCNREECKKQGKGTHGLLTQLCVFEDYRFALLHIDLDVL